MTIRQRILKALYPLVVRSQSKSSGGEVLMNSSHVPPSSPIIDLLLQTGDGKLKEADIKGKKLLLVNTASNCGYTPQFGELQQLYEDNKGKLLIVGFPANDFKEQERGTDAEINEFCQVNYGVSFPVMKKSSVVPGKNQNPIFKWLSTPASNGWNKRWPVWNFSKYLVDEKGNLLGYFGPAVSPLGDEITKRIG